MNSLTFSSLLSLVLILLPFDSHSENLEGQDGPSVTVYSSADPASFDPQQFIAQAQQSQVYQQYGQRTQSPGFGVVKEVRLLELQNGVNALRFSDIAELIDPTTVSFVDLTDPNTAVLEQNFEFDLANPQKILKRYLDHEISVVISAGDSTETVTGTLVSAGQNQLVLKTADGLRILQQNSPQLKLADLPEGLITKPTLVWKIKAAKAGQHRVRTTYQTDGMTWRADYILVLNSNDTKSDISAWVSLMNLSGAPFKNAKLKLIAGDVQRVKPDQYLGERIAKSELMAFEREDSVGFEEKSFFEYHLYTLPRRTDILSNTTQQITLFPTAKDVNVEKVLVYYGLASEPHLYFLPNPMTDRNLGSQSNKKLDIYLRFKNEEKNHLGIPLPRGKVRVYKQDDADGTLEFIGEDLIDHTPKDERVMIKLGQSFDIVGERTQTNFTLDTNKNIMTESFKIELKNHKKEDQKVIIKENLFRWLNWEITEKSESFEKIDARTIHFNLNVPKDGSKVVNYTVKYSW